MGTFVPTRSTAFNPTGIDIAATNGKSFVRSATVIADKVKRAFPPHPTSETQAPLTWARPYRGL